MKPVIITLLFLTTFGDIKHERKQRKIFSNHYYHEYKGKQVIGYICADEPPQ